MKDELKGVLTGTHYLSGNESCAEGAFSAGCRFLGTYPIVSAIEVCDRFLKRAKDIGATFIQMEDEISTLAAVLGASWTGKKSMAVTASPGFSLMMEHVGLGMMLETPCVILDIQHLGPGLGLVTRPAQGDIMQARWGSHGDYEVIALSPSSPQEMFDFTIKAFNLSERYRVPVFLLSDSYVGSLKENVVIPSAEEIEIEPRRYYNGPKNMYLPFRRDEDLVPRMVDCGDGYKFHVTGLTHDERGYPIMNEECQEFNVHPLVWKIRWNAQKIIEIEETQTEDAEVIIVAYGVCARFALETARKAREKGIKVGVLKLNTVWPFAEKKVAELAKKVKAFIVPEMNCGQIVFEVERCSYGRTNVFFIPHGEKGIENTDALLSAINQAINQQNLIKAVIEYK